MFRGIGVVIVLWYIASLFTQTFKAADQALATAFREFETAVQHTEWSPIQ